MLADCESYRTHGSKEYVEKNITYCAVERCVEVSSCDDDVKNSCGTVYDGGCVEAEHVYHSSAICAAPGTLATLYVMERTCLGNHT